MKKATFLTVFVCLFSSALLAQEVKKCTCGDNKSGREFEYQGKLQYTSNAMGFKTEEYATISKDTVHFYRITTDTKSGGKVAKIEFTKVSLKDFVSGRVAPRQLSIYAKAPDYYALVIKANGQTAIQISSDECLFNGIKPAVKVTKMEIIESFFLKEEDAKAFLAEIEKAKNKPQTQTKPQTQVKPQTKK